MKSKDEMMIAKCQIDGTTWYPANKIDRCPTCQDREDDTKALKRTYFIAAYVAAIFLFLFWSFLR